MRCSKHFQFLVELAMEEQEKEQLLRVASLPFIHGHVAAMPDVHYGKQRSAALFQPICAIVPAAVGVDIGCGMRGAYLSVAL